MGKLHDEVVAVARDRGAMVLRTDILESVVLHELKRATTKLVGASLGTGHALVDAVFDSISASATALKLEPWTIVDDVSLTAAVTPAFEFALRLVFANDPKMTFAKVRYAVEDIRVTLTGDVLDLAFEFSFGDVNASFEIDDAGRAAAVAASGIDEKELVRLEGVFAYGMGNRLLRSALGKPKSVQLQKLFPAISFAGKLELKLLPSNLLVIPEQLTLAPAKGCSPFNPLDGAGLDFKSGKDGQFSVSGILPAARRAASQDDPSVALYAPQPLLEQRFEGGTAPAIAHEDVGTGFVGHVLHITAAVKGVSLRIEQGALELSVSVAVWGSATVNVDLPCVGRCDFGRLEVRIPDNGAANLTVALRGGMDTSLRAILTSELKGLNLGTPYVNFSLFGGLKGNLVATVTSYIVDYLIGVIIRNNLNWLIFDAIKEALENKFFVVADLNQLVGNVERLPTLATYSGAPGSALLGCVYSG